MHVVTTELHRYDADPLVIVVPVTNLPAADVTVATWRALGDTPTGKTIGSGITVVTVADARTAYPDAPQLASAIYDPTDAALIVTVDPADITQVGIGRWRWQARAGAGEAQVVAVGWLVVSKTIPAPA